jgi:molecular chaperone HtpG
MKAVRLSSTSGPGLVSLADYVGRMKPGQSQIYYLLGDDAAALARSPHLEGFRARGIEVLLLSDAIDRLWTAGMLDYEGRHFKSASQGSADLSAFPVEEGKAPEASPADAPGLERLLDALRDALAGEVKTVRASDRLTESACILVGDEGDMDSHLARMLRAHAAANEAGFITEQKRILEINPRHKLILRLAENPEAEGIRDAAHLLLDQARILDGEPLPDPAAFARRLSDALARGL